MISPRFARAGNSKLAATGAGLIGLLSLAGCSGSAPGTSSSESAGSERPSAQTTAAITSSEIMARADQWVTDKVPYCGGVRGGTDYICGGTCSRPAAAWDSYRSDCSGFVSWCWQITDDPTTSGYMSDRAGSNGWTTIPIDSMKAGDAIVCDGHIKLFSKFVSATEAEIYEESNCGQVAHVSTQSFTRSGDTLTFAYDSRVYHPIRRNGVAFADYGAQYVSQSWPLASTAMTMTVGQTIAADITLQNVGSKAWDANTKLATSNPRDRASAFFASDWESDHRLAVVKGSVAPGSSYKFSFSFHAPNKPGSYHEFFNLVEEGVAWFSDPAQAGPADNLIEAWIEVQPADWGAELVGTSFASPVTLTTGERLDGWIELKNTGKNTWKAGTTKLAPTPRDATSPIGGDGWLSPTRVSTPTADVAPGASFKFPVRISAGAAGSYTQTFGVVEEGVAWFSDTGQGGPADDTIKLQVTVTDGSSGATTDAGASSGSDAASAPGTQATPGSASGSSMRGSCSFGSPANSSEFALTLGALGLSLLLRRRRPSPERA